MATRFDRVKKRSKRHIRLRKKISGIPERPRLSVFRSAKHIYAQAIDDANGKTIASAATYEKEIRGKLSSYFGNRESAAVIGKIVAERLIKLGVNQVIFDRGGNRYHGRVKALADGAREGGLKF